MARHLSFRWGVGHAAWPPSSPFPLCVRSPGAPPAGACTLVSHGHGRVVRPAPSPRRPPFSPLCPREGGPLSAPPFLHPPPLGGRRRVGGGGPSHFPFVALMSQARGAASLCKGGGGCSPRGSRCRPFYPTPALPVVPPPGLARRVPSSGTVVWFAPPPLPPRPAALPSGGGGVACRLPFIRSPRPLGGGVGWGGKVRPFRLPSVARTSQARRRHDTVTG